MCRRWLSIDHSILLVACLTASVLLTIPALAQAPDDCRQAPATVPENARPLTEQGMRNVVAFTRLLGYVRHFHPSDQAAAADWDTLAIEGMRRIEPCAGPERLATALEAFLRPVAPTVQVFPSGMQPEAPAGLTPPAGAKDLKLVSWRHTGAGQVAKSGNPIYRSERVSATPSSAAPIGSEPDQIFTADLGAGVTTRVPLKLYADATGTLPRRLPPTPAAPDKLRFASNDRPSGNDRATRLAAVALAWNVFQHFYPYFDVVETDWPRALITALTTAATDADERVFIDTLNRLLAALHDGHGAVSHPSLIDTSHAPPLTWAPVEGELVITHVIAEAAAAGLAPGDVVLEIDGQPIEATLSRMRPLISAATPQDMRHTLAIYLRRGAANSVMRLKVQSQAGGQREAVLRRTMGRDALSEPRPATVAELEPGIAYFDIDRATEDDLKAALPKLANAKAVIFDFRGYPKMFTFLSHLSEKDLESPIWQVPIVTRPDRQGVEYPSDRWDLPAADPQLKGRIIFITDGTAISAAETAMSIVEGYRLGDIVGEATAGTNGNINPFAVPGGYVLRWTGMRVLKPDGSRHHGVGILPTHPASRTIKGITERRDEFLERALELAREQRR